LIELLGFLILVTLAVRNVGSTGHLDLYSSPSFACILWKLSSIDCSQATRVPVTFDICAVRFTPRWN
jgi:hypothetical protein